VRTHLPVDLARAAHTSAVSAVNATEGDDVLF
jgi:hypothetical protein